MESWKNRKTLILGRSDMVGLLTPSEYNDCVEHAYRMHGLGRVYMEPKGHIVLSRYRGEFEVMPSYIEEPEAVAGKWVSFLEGNAQYELPAVIRRRNQTVEALANSGMDKLDIPAFLRKQAD